MQLQLKHKIGTRVHACGLIGKPDQNIQQYNCLTDIIAKQ